VEQLYQKIVQASQEGDGLLYEVTGQLFEEALTVFPPHLRQAVAPTKLQLLYTITLHRPSGALLIANRGAALLTKAGFTHKPMIINHLGCAVYLPGHGIEMVDIGTVGDCHLGRVVLRAESACAPSFLFGSQRCNCHDQWLLTQELAAHWHTVEVPDLDPRELERCVIDRASKNTDQPGFILLHFGSQNGMGSGATAEQFMDNLTTTAWLRHRGEYTAEQTLETSMAGGFRSIGLPPDPRLLNDRAGYRIIPIILDFLQVSNDDLHLLTNNQHKITAVRQAGYQVTAIPLYGRIDPADERETQERRDEFHHHLPSNLREQQWQEEIKALINQCSK